MDIREYSLKLLIDSGCSLDCYKGYNLETVLLDLKEYSKHNTVPFALKDVANMLITIGNEQPELIRKGHKQYRMVYDVGHTVDGREFDTFEEAKNYAVSFLEDCVVEEQSNWKLDRNGVPCPTAKQIDSWNDMINEYCVYVVKWDEEKEEWGDSDDAWYPPSEIEDRLNWLEWSDLKKKYGW